MTKQPALRVALGILVAVLAVFVVFYLVQPPDCAEQRLEVQNSDRPISDLDSECRF